MDEGEGLKTEGNGVSPRGALGFYGWVSNFGKELKFRRDDIRLRFEGTAFMVSSGLRIK